VDKTNPVVIGKRAYYQVTDCVPEPRAEGLFIRKSGVIEMPDGQSSIPVKAKDKINLRKISRANMKGKPIMNLADVKLPAGTHLRVSNVHKITAADKGDGVIDADGSADYYLIVDCPEQSSAVGLFVQTQQVEALSEELYDQVFHTAKDELVALEKLLVEVIPKDDATEIFLFNEKSTETSKKVVNKKNRIKMVKSAGSTLPKNTLLTVDPSIIVSDEKEFYRILESTMNPEYVGFYVRVKEVRSSQDLEP
jgi:hypothetical protein